MASAGAVWGIEIGQCALKAVKLRLAAEDQVELVAFDLIEHPKILSQPDADPDELIRAALEKFASRNEWQGDRFVLGVPGQQTFSRFTKLPPVEEKKIADIVKYEAQQQIPFDMDDVVWDYEVFRTEGSPDFEVGIFAMRKDLVRKQIEYYQGVNITPAIIQTIPAALYNFCRFDGLGQVGPNQAAVIVDVGAQKTDLIVVEPNSAWSRNIPLGGNNFTEALVKAFKLPFAKAENLKRTAASSKYARQIFQAMRPVFAELVAEIQRSLGFFSSTHRDVELQTVIACGNAFRLPGLKKYLENNLTIPGGVVELAEFKKLVPSPTVNAPQFSENVLSFGPCYGLAVQGLGLAAISANLLPTELARVALWRQKQPYFIAAAASLLLAGALPWVRSGLDSAALAASGAAGEQARSIITSMEGLASQYRQVQSDNSGKEASLQRLLELHKDTALVPRILAVVHEAAPVVPELQNADSPAALRKLIESNRQRYERTNRREVYIESVTMRYSGNIENEPRAAAVSGGGGAAARSGGVMDLMNPRGESYDIMFQEDTGDSGGGGEGAPGFYIEVTARVPFGRQAPDAVRLIEGEYYANLRQLGRRKGLGFWIPEQDPQGQPGGRNFLQPRLEQYYGSGMAAAPVSSMGARGGMMAPSGRLDELGMPPGTAAGGGLPGSDPMIDPVTGENMSGDWKVTFSFKVKLGEPPEEEPALDQGSDS